jgi:hypothetical protein
MIADIDESSTVPEVAPSREPRVKVPVLLVGSFASKRARVVRLDRAVTEDAGLGVACSPDGRVWFLVERASTPMIKRCRDSECRVLAQLTSQGLSVSPDGKRLAFVALVPRGPVAGWIPSEGGDLHHVVDSETACTTGWASNQTLWVSRRRDGRILWTEVDADTSKETGRSVPGQRDCTDGNEDPASPVNPDLRVIRDSVSQLRLLPRAYLNRH